MIRLPARITDLQVDVLGLDDQGTELIQFKSEPTTVALRYGAFAVGKGIGHGYAINC